MIDCSCFRSEVKYLRWSEYLPTPMDLPMTIKKYYLVYNASKGSVFTSHPSLIEATKAAVEHAKSYPDYEFVVFESISTSKTTSVTTTNHSS